MNNSEAHESTRRSFFSTLALWISGLAVGGTVFAAIRSLVPNVLYEPSKKVKVGAPEFVPEGVTFFKDARAFLFKRSSGRKTKVYAISAVCTHLGCIVQHAESDQGGLDTDSKSAAGFACPCHGSKFTIDGDVVKGPAPTPLPWLEVSIAPDDGQLVVDTATVVNKETSLLVLHSGNGDTRKV